MTATAVGVGPGVSAFAADGTGSAPASAPAEQRHCVTYLGAPDATTRLASVISETCYSGVGSEAKRDQKIASTAAAQKPGGAAAQAGLFGGSFLLVTFYNGINFEGNSDKVYGTAKCDADGYGISDMSNIHKNVRNSLAFWGGVTSFKTWNDCNRTALFTNTNYGGSTSGYYIGNRSYVGDTYNDTYGSMWIKK